MMKRVLLAVGALLALGVFGARQLTERCDNVARFDLYQRRQWCPQRARSECAALVSKRERSR